MHRILIPLLLWKLSHFYASPHSFLIFWKQTKDQIGAFDGEDNDDDDAFYLKVLSMQSYLGSVLKIKINNKLYWGWAAFGNLNN